MKVLISNNARSTISGAINNTQTSISLTGGGGALFPSPTAGDWFPFVIIDGSGNIEITHCTARSVDTLTVARGQEGTVGRSFSAGDRAELRLTAEAIESIQLEPSEVVASLTGSDVLDLLLAADGAGSLLDADLLDAQHGSYYLDYNNFSNTPTIPTPNNPTITFTAAPGIDGGGAITMNQSGAETVTFSHTDTSAQASVNNSGNTVIQDITLDTYGHITGLSSVALTIPTAQSTALGAVGCYGFFRCTTSKTPGTTIAGSSIDYAGVYFPASYSARMQVAAVTTSPAGTWRCMGYNAGGNESVSLFVRIS